MVGITTVTVDGKGKIRAPAPDELGASLLGLSAQTHDQKQSPRNGRLARAAGHASLTPHADTPELS